MLRVGATSKREDRYCTIINNDALEQLSLSRKERESERRNFSVRNCAPGRDNEKLIKTTKDGEQKSESNRPRTLVCIVIL